MQLYPQVKRTWPGNPIAVGWKNGKDFLAGKALVNTGLGVLQLGGAQRLKWLHTLSSQNLEFLPAGESAETLILDINGHIDLSFAVVDDGEITWLLTECPKEARDFLQAMRFRFQVNVTDVSDDYAVLGCLFFSHEIRATDEDSPSSDMQKYLQSHAVATWTDPWPGLVGRTTTFTSPEINHPGQDAKMGKRYLAVIPRPNVSDILHSQIQADLGVWEADRIFRWRPRLGCEGIPGVLPHELDWLRTAVALQKGCYTGQETVAKIVNLGKPPRRLVLLDLDGSNEELPAIGSEVLREDSGEKVGVLTSVAYHPSEGQIGLALVKRRLEPEAVLLIEGARATQTVIVDPSGNNPEQIDPKTLGDALGLRRRNLGGGAKKSPFVRRLSS